MFYVFGKYQHCQTDLMEKIMLLNLIVTGSHKSYVKPQPQAQHRIFRGKMIYFQDLKTDGCRGRRLFRDQASLSLSLNKMEKKKGGGGGGNLLPIRIFQ